MNTEGRYDLIALDMDGTLLDSGKEILPATAQAIRRAQAAGKAVALCTGRALSEVRRYTDALPAIRYGVCMSGATLYDFGREEVIEQRCFSAEEFDAILAAVSGEERMILNLADGEIWADAEHFSRLADFHMEVYRENYDRVLHVLPSEEALLERTRSCSGKICVFHTGVEARERDMARCAALSCAPELARSELSNIELTPRGVTKGDGLVRLCAHLGTDISRAISVGDADNDLPVLSLAGLPVAMGNASERVKEICAVTVADNDHNGCAEAIERFLLGAEQVRR